MRAALVVVLLVACGGRSEVPAAKPAPRQAAKPAPRSEARPPQPVPSAPTSRWIFLEKFDRDEATRATYVAIDLAAAPPTPVSLGAASAVGDDDDGTWTAVAHAGSRWVRAERKGKRHALVLADARGGAERRIDVDRDPTALHLDGDVLLVALGHRLGWIDLAASDPRFQLVVDRAGAHKAYDLFAGTGDRVVAVDDLYSPMLADWLAVGDRAPRRLAGWTLPGLTNGNYTHAALRARGGGRFTLYLIAGYGVRSGHGQTLTALAVARNRIPAEPDPLDDDAAESIPVIREHVDIKTRAPRHLVAGSEWTHWTGLAVDPADGRVLVAANARGLIALPGDFNRDTAGTLVDLGGPVRDVALGGGGLVALVARGHKSELVELTRAGGTYAAGARHPLPAAFDGFVP